MQEFERYSEIVEYVSKTVDELLPDLGPADRSNTKSRLLHQIGKDKEFRIDSIPPHRSGDTAIVLKVVKPRYDEVKAKDIVSAVPLVSSRKLMSVKDPNLGEPLATRIIKLTTFTAQDHRRVDLIFLSSEEFHQLKKELSIFASIENAASLGDNLIYFNGVIVKEDNDLELGNVDYLITTRG